MPQAEEVPELLRDLLRDLLGGNDAAPLPGLDPFGQHCLHGVVAEDANMPDQDGKRVEAVDRYLLGHATDGNTDAGLDRGIAQRI